MITLFLSLRRVIALHALIPFPVPVRPFLLLLRIKDQDFLTSDGKILKPLLMIWRGEDEALFELAGYQQSLIKAMFTQTATFSADFGYFTPSA